MQLEECDLGPHVESHLNKMPDTSTDVHASIASEIKGAARIPMISDRQHRRWQEWRFVLPSMRVPWKNPSFKAVPSAEINTVGIVTENDRRTMSRELRDRRRRPQCRAPHV